MCVGYFDETTRGTSASFTVAGYLSSKARWREFEAKWARALRREGLNAFNADDFSRGTGEFANGWDDDAKRRGLVEGLSKLTEQHAFRAFSCSVLLEQYAAIDAEYAFSESAAGPYGLCAALVIANVRQSMATKHPNDLTLFVFGQGDIDQRELRRILKTKKAEQGEPAQVWPRQWVDERGRHRYLRPLEACELFAADRDGRFVNRLIEHSALDRQLVGRDQLVRICQALEIAPRSQRSLFEQQTTLGTR